MIKKENRLKKRKQFNYLHKFGSYVSNEFMSVIYLPVKTKSFKIGYSVSKKVGKAVVRNKIKRRLKECVKKISDKIKQNYYIIISPKTSINTLTFNDIFEYLNQVLKKANLINDNC